MGDNNDIYWDLKLTRIRKRTQMEASYKFIAEQLVSR